MAKTSKKKRNEPVSINNVYEMIKNRGLVHGLWMEIIADIGNKPTYKHIKKVVCSAVNDTLSDFDTEPPDNLESLRRRGVFTEISIMAYTVDRVISEFLYRRLQSEFKSMIGSMLKELQTKKEVKEATPMKINSMFENIESIFTTNVQSSPEEGSVPIQQVEANPRPLRKRGRPRKNVATFSSESSFSKTVETIEKSDGSDSLQPKDSDVESNLTFDSLSSVNTNDLSSFDDNVSICTDDGENGMKKKRVPLKKANAMIVEGKLPDIYKLETTPENNKRKRESGLRKVLPQRRRKPNSRYNAETMYCHVKQSSSPRGSPISDDPSDEDMSSVAVDETANVKSEIHQEAKHAKMLNNKSEHSSKASSSSAIQVTTRSLRRGSPTQEDPSQNVPMPTSSSTPLGTNQL